MDNDAMTCFYYSVFQLTDAKQAYTDAKGPPSDIHHHYTQLKYFCVTDHFILLYVR